MQRQWELYICYCLYIPTYTQIKYWLRVMVERNKTVLRSLCRKFILSKQKSVPCLYKVWCQPCVDVGWPFKVASPPSTCQLRPTNNKSSQKKAELQWFPHGSPPYLNIFPLCLNFWKHIWNFGNMFEYWNLYRNTRILDFQSASQFTTILWINHINAVENPELTNPD